MPFYTAIPKVRAIDFRDAAGDPATLGRVQRNGDMLKYWDGGEVTLMNGFQFKRITGTQNIDNTTFTNVTNASFEVLNGEVWAFHMQIAYTSPTDEDGKIQITVPGTSVLDFTIIYFTTAGTVSIPGAVSAATSVQLLGAAATVIAVNISGTVSADADGTVQAQMAQDVQVDADALQIQIGGHTQAWRLS